MNTTVLSVENLRTYFHTEEGEIPAVNGVSFTLERGRVLALVGESGCGKSVTWYSILRLIRPPGRIMGGKIVFYPKKGNPIDIAALNEKSDALYRVRGGYISMIFQEPMTALSPVHTVGNQICEAILLHQDVTPERARETALEMLRKVGIPGAERRIDQYPHEMSGGMRQRVVIARALIVRPSLVVADEAVSALDVSVQAQVINLLADLQEELGLTYIFVAHDLSVVRHLCDRVAVMYAGKIVELASSEELFEDPKHPYTRALLSAVPDIDPDVPMNFRPRRRGGRRGQAAAGMQFSSALPASVRAVRQGHPRAPTPGWVAPPGGLPSLRFARGGGCGLRPKVGLPRRGNPTLGRSSAASTSAAPS